MAVTASLVATDQACGASFHQMWKQFGPALDAAFVDIGALQSIEALHLTLTLVHSDHALPAYEPRSYHKASRAYFSGTQVDFERWRSRDWRARAAALAEALTRAVSRVAKTRLSAAERGAVVAAIAHAQRAVESEPPPEVEPVGPGPELLADARQASFPEGFKLYKRLDGRLRYREAWANPQGVVDYRGICGERGEVEQLSCEAFAGQADALKRLKDAGRAEDYRPIPPSKHAWLVVEFALDAFSSDEAAVIFRHELEDYLNELTGWLGLGHCDGGSFGSGTLEVACPVVDYAVAETVLARELAGGKFAGYSRIYRER